LITALIKIASLFTKSPVFLESIDPIFNVSYKALFIGISFGEIIVSTLCLKHARNPHVLFGLFGIGCAFGFYHFSRWITGAVGPCPCLGGAIDYWPAFNRHQDEVLWGLVMFMFSGPCLLWSGLIDNRGTGGADAVQNDLRD
jgi:dipeptide/tripeptide permease